jgi:hypothetical protein
MAKDTSKTDPVHQDVDLQGMCRLREVLTREAMHNVNAFEEVKLKAGAYGDKLALSSLRATNGMEEQIALSAARDAVPSLLRAAVLTAGLTPSAPAHIKKLADPTLLAAMSFNDLATRVIDPVAAAMPLPNLTQLSRQLADNLMTPNESIPPTTAQKLCDYVAKGGLRGGVKPN